MKKLILLAIAILLFLFVNSASGYPDFPDNDSLSITTVIVKVEDLNDDDSLDIISLDMTAECVVWFENDGTSAFTKHIINSSTSHPYSLDVVDLDSDGDLDIVAGSYSSNWIYWFENDGTGTFTNHTVRNSYDSYFIVCGDINGDGDNDIVVSSRNEGTNVSVLINDGSNNFDHLLIDDTYMPYKMNTTDLNGDGYLDIVATDYSSDSGGTVWFKNNGSLSNPGFTKNDIATYSMNSKFSIMTGVYCSDIDGDSDIDVLTSCKKDDSLYWFENNGSISNTGFTEHAIFSNGWDLYMNACYAVDYDSDSDVDTFSGQLFSEFGVNVNDGSESFTSYNYSGYTVESCDSGDIDNDGDIDIIFAEQQWDQYIWIFYNDLSEQNTINSVSIYNETYNSEISLNNTNVSTIPTSINISIENEYGDTMDLYIYTNYSGSTELVNSSLGLSNGTYSFINTSWVDEYNKDYWMHINISGGTAGTKKCWINETYHFDTNTTPMFSDQKSTPTTGTELDTTFVLNCTITDLDNDSQEAYAILTMGSWTSNLSMSYTGGFNNTGGYYEASTTLPTYGIYTCIFKTHDSTSWNMESTWTSSGSVTITVNANTTFQLNFPQFLEVGQYVHAQGTIKNSTGYPLNNTWVTTKLVDNTDWTTVEFSQLDMYIQNGLYLYVFSTTSLVPGVYSIIVNYSYLDVEFTTNRTLYLSDTSGPGHYATDAYFNFYNNDTGIGLSSETFKVYADDDTTLDRQYENVYKNIYTGVKIYYRIDDYFDNQIYPNNGSAYATVYISTLDQAIDIPVDWNSFSVKNMNHSIIYFKMTNGSTTYSQYLFPYEPFYWNVLDGEYTINLTYYDSFDTTPTTIEGYSQTNITVYSDYYYWIKGYDLQDIIIEINAVNTSLDSLSIDISAGVTLKDSCVNNISLKISTNLTAFETNITNLLLNQNTNISLIDSIVNSINTTIRADINYINATIDTVNNKIDIDLSFLQSNITWMNNTIYNYINTVNSTINTQTNTISTWITAQNSNITNMDNDIQTQISIIESNITSLNNKIWNAINITDSVVDHLNNNIFTEINITRTKVTYMNNTIWTEFNAISSKIDNLDFITSVNYDFINSTVSNLNNKIWNSLNLTDSVVGHLNNNVFNEINITRTKVTYINNTVWSEFTSISNDIANLDFITSVNYDFINSTVSEMNNKVWNALNITDSVVGHINNNVFNEINISRTIMTYMNNSMWTRFTSIDNDIAGLDFITSVNYDFINSTVSNLNNKIWSALNITDSVVGYVNNTIWANLTTIDTVVDTINGNIDMTLSTVNTNINNLDFLTHINYDFINSTVSNLNNKVWNAINITDSVVNHLNNNVFTEINITKTYLHYMNNSMWLNFTTLESDIAAIDTSVSIDYDVINSTVENMNHKIWSAINVTDSIVDHINNTIWSNLTTIDTVIDTINGNIDMTLSAINTNINNLDFLTSVNYNIINATISNMNQKVWTALNITDSVVDYLNSTIWGNLSVMNSTLTNVSIDISGELNIDDSNITNLLMDVWGSINITNSSLNYMNTTIWGEFTIINTDVNNTQVMITGMWKEQNNSFQNLENRSTVVFSFYNTNEGLGLDRETMKVYINNSRLIGNIYYTYNESDKINLKVKDYYNNTMYNGNFTITDSYTFIDLGLTYHSYLFGNLDEEWYMLSFRKNGANFWWERAIVPNGQTEFLMPSGTYRLRIYDKANTEIYNASESVIQSKGYIIYGTNLSSVITGQSVIKGDLLELMSDLDAATRPDIVTVACDISHIYSVYDKKGMDIGSVLVCPPLITFATTTNETMITQNTTSYPLVPDSDNDNGTIYVRSDEIRFSGNSSRVHWVSVVYNDSSHNYSYLPNTIDLDGENVSVNCNCHINITRVTEYEQQQTFYWTKYLDTLEYEATISIDNPFNSSVEIEDVYCHMGFANDTTPDYSTVSFYDVTNGIYLTEGENFMTLASGINWYLASIAGNTSRSFTAEYTAETGEITPSTVTVTSNDYDSTTLNDDPYFFFSKTYLNEGSTFEGTINIQFNFSTPYQIDSTTVKVRDETNGEMLERDEFTFFGTGITIMKDAVGTVSKGSTREYSVYFNLIKTEDRHVVEESVSFLKQPIIDIGGYSIFVGHLAVIVLGAAAVILYDKRKKERNWISMLLGFFAIILFIVTYSGV